MTNPLPEFELVKPGKLVDQGQRFTIKSYFETGFITTPVEYWNHVEMSHLNKAGRRSRI
jgi:hypothetical protein